MDPDAQPAASARDLEELAALLAQARADRDRLQRRNLQLEDQARLLRRVPLLTTANRVRRGWGERRSARPRVPVVTPPHEGPPEPGRYIDVTVLANPVRSGISRVAVHLARGTGYRLVEMQGGRLVHSSRFHEEVFARPDPHDDAGRPLGLGPGVTVVNAAIQLGADYPAWRSAISQLRGRGGHYVQIVHDLLPITLPDFFDLGMRERFPDWLSFVVANADLVATDSAATRDDLMRWADGRPGAQRTGKVAVLPLGCDPAPRRHRASGRAVPELLVVGTIEPRKAVEAVLDAAACLRAAGTPVTVSLVGGRGWSDESTFARIARLERAGWVTWLSDCDDEALAARYAGADLLVAASRGEGYGLPVAEAMAAGLPVVARDLPVFRELLGDWGHYFGLDDQLAPTILAALAAPPPGPPPTTTTWADAAAALDALVTRAEER